jgi:predicted HAD superfamily Cof-like phosphohydrolase
MEFIEKVKLFNAIAGQPEEFNPRKIALYVGLICEEFAEIIDSFDSGELAELADTLDDFSLRFKSGAYDNLAAKVDCVEFLDGCIDVAVVATGAAICVGADIVPAFHHIADNNLSKYNLVDGEYVVLRDENGKIMKPSNYQKPNLAPFFK